MLFTKYFALIGQEITCTPTDHWETVQACDNLENAYPTTCTYEYTTGVTRGNKYSYGESTSNTVSTSIEAGGGINIEGLSANFKTTLGTSRTTGNNWGTEMASTYNVQRRHSFVNNIPAHAKVVLKQVIGRCGDFVIYGRIKMVSG